MEDKFAAIRQAIPAGKYDNKLQDASGPLATRTRRAEDARLVKLLRDDIEAAAGTKRYEKRDALWEMAWERGHAEGPPAVLREYGDLLEILPDAAFLRKSDGENLVIENMTRITQRMGWEPR